jgi:hypothetical protein
VGGVLLCLAWTVLHGGVRGLKAAPLGCSHVAVVIDRDNFGSDLVDRFVM